MSYNRICIERERDGFEVTCTDPAIVKQNETRNAEVAGSTPWKDPEVEFYFETKEQVLKFLEGAIEKALPRDEYSSTFDKLAKDAMT